MRATSLLLVGAALGAGCSVDATGVLVTLHLSVTAPAFDHVDAKVLRDGVLIGSRSYAAMARDGDTFGVLLADDSDGSSVVISVDALSGTAVVCHGETTAHVVRHSAALAEVDLSCGSGGGDAGMGDMEPAADLLVTGDGPMPDLSRADGSDLPMPMEDLVVASDLVLPVDQVMLPDLVKPCAPSCAASVAVVCEAGVARMVNCAFGCNGAQCGGPTSCMSPGDISVPGDYWASSAGAASTTSGSCNHAFGPDNTLKLTSPKQWSNVTLTVGAGFTVSHFTRLVCSDATSELIMNGQCNGAALASACDQGMKSTQVLCGVPPSTTLYTFVADPGGPGGLYDVQVAYTPVDLNSCAQAGMMPGSSFTVSGDTSLQANRNAAPVGTANCGDRGATSPEAVYWVPVPTAGKTLSVSVTGVGNFQPLLYLEPYCVNMAASTLCDTGMKGTAQKAIANASTGPWMIFVDGQNGASGQFSLTVSLK